MAVNPISGVRCPKCGRKSFAFRSECMKCGHPFEPAPKDADVFERMRGAAVSTNPQVPYVAVVRGPWIDEEGYERAERINGCVVCPHCDLVIPCFEEVVAWMENVGGAWVATEWGPGTAECAECGAVFVDTFDGCFELKRS